MSQQYVPPQNYPPQPTQTYPPQNSSVVDVLDRRLGLVTFAAIMMFLLFGLYATVAMLEFFQGTWLLLSTSNVPGGYLWVWGIVDAGLALIALYAGYDILMGGQAGRIIGLVFAIISAVRWFFFLPIAPFAAMAIIAVDILIIYGLVAHGEYFRAASGGLSGQM